MGKMRKIIEYIILAFALLLASFPAAAQADRREVRSGNRQFRKENFTRAEIDYRKALVKDSSSFAASYDLANSLYMQNNFEEAGKTLEKVKDIAPMSPNSSDYYYNLGNVACQKKDWQAAVDAYKQSLLRKPAEPKSEPGSEQESAEPKSEPESAEPAEPKSEPGSAESAAGPARAGQNFSSAGSADAQRHSGEGKGDPGQGQ